MPQARTPRDVGGIKEVWRGLQHRSAPLVVQEVAHRFPGWGVISIGSHARRDLNRALGGHRQGAVWLLHRKEGHGIAKKVNVLTADAWLWQYHELIGEAALLCTV